VPSVGRAPEAPSAAQGHDGETEIIAAVPSRPPVAPGEQPQAANRGFGLAGPVANGIKPSGLPAAGTPWEGGNGLEDEIERALRSDPRSPASLDIPAVPANRASPVKSETDPGTTLGDLAARLESALAREIVAAQNGAGGLGSEGVEASNVSIDEFAFEPEGAAEMPKTQPTAPIRRPRYNRVTRPLPSNFLPRLWPNNRNRGGRNKLR
jgi:hypothetical protein